MTTATKPAPDQDLPFGQLSDGTPITGSCDGGGRSGIVSAQPDGWYLNADDDGRLCLNDTDTNGNSINLEAVTMAQLAALRALLNSGVCEQLLAAAVAYGAGDAAPPTFGPDAYTAGYADGKRDTLRTLTDQVMGRAPAAVQNTLATLDRVIEAIEPDDDDESRTVYTDTSRPILVERVEYGADRAWLEFTITDRALVSVDILGGEPGLELLISGHQVGGSIGEPPLTLADLRQIHADLGAMLADDRLLGALAEQQG